MLADRLMNVLVHAGAQAVVGVILERSDGIWFSWSIVGVHDKGSR